MRSLVGYWKLRGDCRDYSVNRNHGTNRGVVFAGGDGSVGVFNGANAYVEVPDCPAIRLGASDFAISVWVHTEKHPDGVIGDVLDLYDPAARRGVTLTIDPGGAGYQGPGSDRRVHFGIDNAREGAWEDCGRPNPKSKYVSNSLTVYKGRLYTGTSGGRNSKDWAHVYRYEGGREWTDCGRVGDGRTTGVGPLIVHNGELYAVTSTYDWTRVLSRRLGYEPGRVYRYEGGQKWADCGAPSENRTPNCAVSYNGKLYVGGGPDTWGVFVQDGRGRWKASALFPREGNRRCFPHAMGRYHGKLVVCFPCVYMFDGAEWTYAGVPVGREADYYLQSHTLAVHQGNLLVGTWPDGIVARHVGGEEWQAMGRVGRDGTEVMDLLVYNGKLYGCSIPRAEVCRYDGGPAWTSLKRFHSPKGWTPVPPKKATPAQVKEWARVTSMTIYDGKLFAGTGNCTSSVLDSPENETLGRVFCLDAGRVASDGHDLGPGWKHIAAVREKGLLKLYTNGRLAAVSAPFDPADYDITTGRPLRIGFGQTDYFRGKIAELRLYNRALGESEIAQLAAAPSSCRFVAPGFVAARMDVSDLTCAPLLE